MSNKKWAEIGVEYWTGEYRAGKKIYGKIIGEVGALPNNTGKVVPHNINGFGELIELKGAVKTPNQRMLPAFSGSAFTSIMSASANQSNVTIATLANQSEYSIGYFSIMYTCTDR